jgi:hypothetical protein
MNPNSWLSMVFGIGFTAVVIVLVAAFVTVLVNRAISAKLTSPPAERPHLRTRIEGGLGRQVVHVQADRWAQGVHALTPNLQELEAARAAVLDRGRS